MDLKRVVITGLGALTPIGLSVESYWDALLKGVSGAGPITRFDATNFKTKFACELKGFDVLDYMPRKEAQRMDPCAQYASVAAMEAIRDAGLDLDKVNKDREHPWCQLRHQQDWQQPPAFRLLYCAAHHFRLPGRRHPRL